jgi:hypothetical protein
VNDPNHPLTQQDLSDIKDKMYDKMRENEGDKKTEYKKDANGNVVWDNNGYGGEPVQADPSDKSAAPGVKRSTTDDFINSDPKLKKMFDDNHLRIDHVDNTGAKDGSSNHVVLEETDGNGHTKEVYDPYMRKDGNQVITDEDQLKMYRGATRHSSNDAI